MMASENWPWPNGDSSHRGTSQNGFSTPRAKPWRSNRRSANPSSIVGVLIPADGFYEWPNKQPTLIHFPDDRLFCFAGLWLDGTMTMITCAPNDFMRPIHHRMPAILRDEDYAAWLDPQSPTTELQSLIATRNWEGMQSDAIPKLTPDSPLSAPKFTREH